MYVQQSLKGVKKYITYHSSVNLSRLKEELIMSQNKTHNYIKLALLVKIILYYEVPQNALCSLCLHCLNTGSKNPGDPLSAPESQTS